MSSQAKYWHTVTFTAIYRVEWQKTARFVLHTKVWAMDLFYRLKVWLYLPFDEFSWAKSSHLNRKQANGNFVRVCKISPRVQVGHWNLLWFQWAVLHCTIDNGKMTFSPLNFCQSLKCNIWPHLNNDKKWKFSHHLLKTVLF